jgi:mono/diheme cytochrome c family protein
VLESARKKSSFVGITLVVLTLLASAQFVRAVAAEAAKPWKVPAAAKALKNPVPSTPKNLAAAKENYKLDCSPCHGDKGDGDSLMGSSLDPRPANFTDAKQMRAQTDGELFWKLNEGRMPMPAFKDQLSETERWQLVDYIRSFVKAAPAGKAASASGK